ncbi:MAG TPA: HEAT repeat domain-containing protein [Verrucomicrobiae bacterium]|nr:HEAT repeat domain-containing protein [Verrucomicrobiae bacterium]
MKKILIVGAMLGLWFGTASAISARETQAQLIQELSATNSTDVITDAMSELERRNDRGDSQANAVPALKLLLPDDRSLVRRKAARLLGIFHAQLTDAEVQEVCRQLHSTSREAESALKALQDLDAKSAVPEVILMLRHSDTYVVRDACRTLAVIGDKSAIPSLEPLLQSPNKSVVKDAQKAIDQLKARS